MCFSTNGSKPKTTLLLNDNQFSEIWDARKNLGRVKVQNNMYICPNIYKLVMCLSTNDERA